MHACLRKADLSAGGPGESCDPEVRTTPVRVIPGISDVCCGHGVVKDREAVALAARRRPEPRVHHPVML